jgi:uncharacterized protein YwgA
MKVELDQTVYIKTWNRGRDNDIQIIDAVVTKVGRKYFEVNNSQYPFRYPFEIETGTQKSDFSNQKAYETKKDIEEEIERNNLSNSIRFAFRSYGTLPYSLEVLREISKLINQQ